MHCLFSAGEKMVHAEQRSHGNDDKPQSSRAPRPSEVSLSSPCAHPEWTGQPAGQALAEGVALEPLSSLQQALVCFASRGSFFWGLQLLLEQGAGGLGLIHCLLPRLGLSHHWGKQESQSLLQTWDDLLKSTGLDFLLPPPCESCEIPLSEQRQLRSRCQRTQGLPGQQCLAQAGPPCLEERTNGATLHKNVKLTRKPSCHLCKERKEQEWHRKLKRVKENDSLVPPGEAG